MKREVVIFFVLIAFISGCGDTKERRKIKNKEPIVTNKIDKKSKTYFGLLGDATINIYELGSTSKKLIKTLKTSSGITIDEIGNFNPYYEILDSKKFYQYELIGGKNWDLDRDFVVDDKPSDNNRVYKRTNRGAKTQVDWWCSRSSGYKAVISD
jgi:hypothetical protein